MIIISEFWGRLTLNYHCNFLNFNYLKKFVHYLNSVILSIVALARPLLVNNLHRVFTIYRDDVSARDGSVQESKETFF